MDPDFNDQILFILEQTGIYNRLVEDNLNQISSLIEMAKNEIKKP
jgi:ABC-type Na+ transport system ATPase subunit NatA